MTGHFRNLARPSVFIRVAVLPLLAIAALLVTGDSASAAAACKCFAPNPTSTYSTTEPGSNPDIAGTFDIGVGPNGLHELGGGDDTNDYNFGGVVAIAPAVPADAEITDGAILGQINSVATLGLINAMCTNQTPPIRFIFMEATTDIDNTVDMLEFGIGNELAVIAGDNPPFGNTPDVKPPPGVTQYPAFLNAIFDPDWVDYGPDKKAGNADDNWGPSGRNPIKPRFRAFAATSLGFAQGLWVVLQQVTFEPGTKLPQLPAIDAAYGYPSVTVLQTASAAGSATPPIAGVITDFCTPLKVDSNLFGLTVDNPDTGPNEGGVPLRTLPAEAGTPITTIAYYTSQRDADGDGYENGLDPCPLPGDEDTVWNPRDLGSPPFAGDGPDETPASTSFSDGIPDICDPTPTVATGNTDHDGDAYLNRGDNCPLIANGKSEENTPAGNQKDTDKNEAGEEVGDGIGDACDPNPGTPDGASIVCVRLQTVRVGGPGQAAVADCLEALPALVGGKPPTADDPSLGGAAADTTTTGGSGSGAGGSGAGGTGAGAGAGGAGGPASGIGSLSPVAGTVPAWAAIAAGLGAAGLIGSLGTLASRLVKRRRDD
jgi:Thrombospondin type 3 repeat